tara:strand:- start:50 stop:556 length:507 start_codon:yes stop_codon:yes gene_type:complete
MANNILNKSDLGVHNANKRGKKLELEVEKYLIEKGISYKYTPNNGIDFIIYLGDETIHMDCVSTGTTGSVDEKLPTKVDKYVRKYNLREGNMYLLHPYSGLHQTILDGIDSMERLHDMSCHVLDWADFYNLMENKFTPSKKVYSNNGSRWVRPSDEAINRFFEFKKCT